MTIIDQKTWTSYPNLTAKQAADMIGVALVTIYRWKKSAKKQQFNHLLVIFQESNVN